MGSSDSLAWESLAPDIDTTANPQLPKRPKVGGAMVGAPSGRISMDESIIKENRALELKMAGASKEQIADVLNYPSADSAMRAAVRALHRDSDRISGDRESMRTMMGLRLERAVRAIWPQVVRGDLFAVDRLLKIMERQAKVFGLDAPTQVMLTDGTKTELMRLVGELEQAVIPGEVEVDVLGSGADSADQGEDRLGVGRRAGGEGADRGDGSSAVEADEDLLVSLPVAGPSGEDPDDGHLVDARRSGDGED